LIGAVAGTGGWLLAAPGTPLGVPGPGLVRSSVRCWLRTAAGSVALVGRNSSAVDSVCEKSTRR
jgi:hypothetical protein